MGDSHEITFVKRFGTLARTTRRARSRQPARSARSSQPCARHTNDTMSAMKDTVGHGVGVVSAEMTSTTDGRGAIVDSMSTIA